MSLQPTIMEHVNNERKMEEIYNKSIQKRPTTTNVKETKKKTYTKKQLFTAIAVAVALSAATSSIATTKVSNFVDQIEIDNTFDKAYSDYILEIDQAVDQSKFKDKFGKVVDYDKISIASNIKDFTNSTEERDTALFVLYDRYGTNKSDATLNGIFSQTVQNFSKEDGTSYQGTTDYIKDLGYENLDEYEKNMKEKLVNKYNYEQENNINYGGK